MVDGIIQDQSVQANLITSLEDVCSDFSKLLASGEASDAQLKCGDVTRPVHRSVLSARSSVFSAMFLNEVQESATGQVDIDDINPDLLDIFLKFVYAGRIPETFSEDRYPDLYALGDKYAVHSLKRLCFEGMMDRLTKNNFHSLLALVDGHGDEAFKDRVVECIADHPQWLDSGSWIKFSEEHSKLALHVYRKSHEGSRSKKRPHSEITV